jgi:hypothetical protein
LNAILLALTGNPGFRGNALRFLGNFAANVPKAPDGDGDRNAGAVTELGPEPPLEVIVRETAANQEAFTRLRADFAHHEGNYALMKSGMIIDFFADRKSALLAGHERFVDQLYSVHRMPPHERRQDDGMAPPDERRHASS